MAHDKAYYEAEKMIEEAQRSETTELDAYYDRLYGLSRDELRYILDPKEVYEEDFPGEIFLVPLEKEIKRFGYTSRFADVYTVNS
jgi:hypothetical protein